MNVMNLAKAWCFCVVLVLAGCATLPEQPQTNQVEAPRLIETTNAVHVEAISQYFVVLSVKNIETWEQQVVDETVTHEAPKPIVTDLEVGGNYWNSEFCISENISPIEIQQMQVEGHYFLRFHKPLSQLPHLNLMLRHRNGEHIGDICIGCASDKRCN